MSKVLTQIRFTQVVRDIKTIIRSGHDNNKKNDRKRVLKMNWEIGRYLSKHLPLSEMSGAQNSKVIGHIARTFCQPKIYFDTVIGFYNEYPDAPPDKGGMSWEDYKRKKVTTPF